MFLTLKSELHSPMMIQLEDNSTFGELKNKVEEHLEIAKSMQKISSLQKDYEDNDVILESLIDEELNGGVLLLNVYNRYNMEADFYGFLHIYRKEDKAKEDFKNLEDNFESLRKQKVPAFEKNTTIVIESSQETANDSSSSSSTSSDDDNDDRSEELSNTSDENDSKKSRIFSGYRKPKENNDKLSKKRAKDLDDNQCKRSKNSLEHEEYFYEYLDDDYEANAVQDVRPSQKSLQETNKLPRSKEKMKVNLSIDTKISNSSDKESLTPPIKTASTVEVSSARKKQPSVEKSPPYALINPEQRKFVIVITNDAEKITFCDYEDFFMKLLPFFSKESLAHIRFDPLFPAVLYQDKLWLACSNELSYQWTLKTILQVFKGRFIGHNLSTYWKMKTFSVNMVNVGQFKDWFGILKTMEIQNPGLHTDMWIVKKMNQLKRSDKNSGNFTEPPNVVILFSIDKQSAEFLKQNDYSLLYALWTLKFNLIEEKP